MTIPILNGAGATQYLKASGVGSSGDPYIPEHTLGAGTANVGDVDVLTVVGDNADLDSGVGDDPHAGVAVLLPAPGGHVIGGTPAAPFRVDTVASTVLPVSIASMYVPANVLASIPNVPSVSIASVYAPLNVVGSIIGNAAVTATVSGVAAVAIASFGAAAVKGLSTTSNPAPVADATPVAIRTDTTGAIVSRPYANQEVILNAALKGSGATAAQALIAAQGSGYRAYITDWQLMNANASLVTEVCLHDGTTTLALGYAAALGGFAFRFGVPIQPAANASISILAATASVQFLTNVQGFKGI